MKKVLQLPVTAEELADIRVGDVIYVSGRVTTCRDSAHRRFLNHGRPLPVDFHGAAIFHAGPIVREENGHYTMVAVGPTTSMRMEGFEAEFIERTGVRVIIGKGGMGDDTAAACKKFGAIHCVFPAGCAVLAASCVDSVSGVEWRDLGMPECLWLCETTELGPLIVSIDTQGNNLFAESRRRIEERKGRETARLAELVKDYK